MKTDFNKQGCKSHRATSSLGCAIFIILLGTILLAFNLGWIPAQYKALIVSWQMLIIALGVGSLFKRHYTGGVLLVAIGLFFMLPVIDKVFPGLLGGQTINLNAYWPVLLIVGGILLIIHKKSKTTFCSRNYSNNRKERIHNDADYVEKNAIFNSSEQIIFSSNFTGGDVNVAFGEIKLDLRKISQINESSLLEINAMFGSVVILIPANWFLEMKTDSLFGSVDDKRSIQRNSTIKLVEPEGCEFILKMNCNCMFGSIEIRD